VWGSRPAGAHGERRSCESVTLPRGPANETMSIDPHPSHKSAPRMVVRGALALELVPGSQPGRAALRQTEAGTLAGLVGRDLATLTADAAALDLVFAGAHYDPAEMLRPDWPLHRRLEELHARAPHAQSGTDIARVIAFGADAQGAVPQPLRAELELHGGPLRVLPFLLVGRAEHATAVAAEFEHSLLERGMAKADTALRAQDAFDARIEHARYLTAYDLAAMIALQYRHVGLGALWPLVETALLAPEEETWLDAPPEPLLRYADGVVRIAEFDRNAWQLRYATHETDPARIDRDFAQFQARRRQLAAILKVHGIDVRHVPCSVQHDPRVMLLR
jgi:hypothetical protein